ncbi:hypothetical protein Moror_1187 [Moniliophthora roreri MCA 2997]|uniref:Uncharacterized protein n=2 Tax=Moniliophthora roreri TaxID=221103 RepID=V2YE57_MONRO|nr:hypothetical protein Moror_1187 [Moniliophthora roreri MCA 2997]KAI3604688.1 hypothetical protein WG66_008289 [Moniliophthora roreri]
MIYLYVFIFLISIIGVHSFSLEVPSSVIVTDQFPVRWTWLTSEPDRVVIVLYDTSKVADCDVNGTPKREQSFTVLNIQDRIGSIGFYAGHAGTFQTCAFSYNATSGTTPVNSLLANIGSSSTFTASVLATTVTQSASSVPGSSGSQAPSIAGPVIGGVIGGVLALSLLTAFILYRFCHYRVIRLPADPPPLPLAAQSTSHHHQTQPSLANVHPGVSPFPQSAYTSPRSSNTNLPSAGYEMSKGRARYAINGTTSSASSSRQHRTMPSGDGSWGQTAGSSQSAPSEAADTPPAYSPDRPVKN